MGNGWHKTAAGDCVRDERVDGPDEWSFGGLYRSEASSVADRPGKLVDFVVGRAGHRDFDQVVADQSRALNERPAWATDGIATRKPETTKNIAAYSQPRTRRVMILTSLLGLTQELTRIRRGRDIRLDRADVTGPRNAASSEPSERVGRRLGDGKSSGHGVTRVDKRQSPLSATS
jgi:hypothetical protein